MAKQAKKEKAAVDAPKLEKIADVVNVNVRHKFSEDDQKQNSQLLVKALADKENEELEKKVMAAEFKSRIDGHENEIKKLRAYLKDGYTYMDKPATLYLNHETLKREYRHKETNELLKEEDFKASDYQKKLKFDTDEDATNAQIAENNAAGAYANGDNMEAGPGQPDDDIDDILGGDQTDDPLEVDTDIDVDLDLFEPESELP